MLKLDSKTSLENQKVAAFGFYAGIDRVNERIRDVLAGQGEGTDKKKLAFPSNYLGFVGNMGDIQMYAYVSKTRVKVLVGTRISIDVVSNPYASAQRPIERVCKQLYEAYVNTISNPFVLIADTAESEMPVDTEGAMTMQDIMNSTTSKTTDRFLSVGMSSAFTARIEAIVREFNKKI